MVNRMFPCELFHEIFDFCDIETQIKLQLIFKLKSNFNWKNIKKNCNLNFSENFITEFHNKIFINCKNKVKYTKQNGYFSIFNWNIISKRNLSEKFIREFSDKIKWRWIYRSLNNRIYSNEFLIKFEKQLSREASWHAAGS